MIVKSIAGHDKDRFYLVVKLQKDRAYIVDGKTRLLEKPKSKNLIHLRLTKKVIDVEEIKSNKKVRGILSRYNNYDEFEEELYG